jgi:DDE superfamily endonuclease
VFLIDECHLLWGDVCGYAWGRSDLRIEVPIKNERERQTYYGALDYRTKEFILKGYETANSKNTEDFVKFLQGQRPGPKIAIFWDKATYHCSQEFRNYLDSLNQDKESEQWQIIGSIPFL